MSISINPVSQYVQSEIKRCADDFVYFCENYLKINHPKQGLIPFKLHDFQKRYVQHINSNDYTIATKFRQGGFTTVTIAYFFWRFLFEKDQISLMLATKTDREAIQLMNIARQFLQHLPDELSVLKEVDINTKHELKKDGSVLRAGVIGYSCGKRTDYLYMDEPAFWTNAEEAWRNFFPCVANLGSKVVVLSTPNGVCNWFEQTYHDACDKKNNFSVFLSSYTEHPDYQNTEWVRELKNNLGPKGFAQEILCSFVSADADCDEFVSIKDNDKPIKLAYDDELHFTPEKDRAKVVPKPKLVFENDEGGFSDPTDFKCVYHCSSDDSATPPRTAAETCEKVQQDYQLKEENKNKLHPHNPGYQHEKNKRSVYPHNNGIWTVEPENNIWDFESVKSDIAESIEAVEAVAALDINPRRSADKPLNIETFDLLKLSGFLPSDTEVSDLVEEGETSYCSLVIEILADEDLPENLQIKLGSTWLEVKDVPTKIKSEDVKHAYDGLKPLIGEVEARKYVAKLIRKKIKKLF